MTWDALRQRLPAGVFLQGVTYDAARASTWREWLSSDERARMEGFGASSRRHEFLAGRAAARRLLAERLGVDPSDVPLRHASDGGVDVKGTNWRVSIAHSEGHAMAVCAQDPIGGDLERIQPRDPAVARFLFAPNERGLLQTLPYDEPRALILCWVLKEAVLKARRTGFRVSPKDLYLSVRSGRAHVEVGRPEGGDWSVHFSEVSGYWAAVALPAS